MRGDPLDQARRTLLTGAALLTDKQQARLDVVFADDRHTEVEATWGVYQDMITVYREKDRGLGRFLLQHTIDRITAGVPDQLVEVRTLKQRATDVLSYFDRPGTSNGPTEAINGRLEHLRGTALGFCNLSHHIARSLLDAGGFRPQLHPAS
jgi:Transposase and inactivated derivatives